MRAIILYLTIIGLAATAQAADPARFHAFERIVFPSLHAAATHARPHP